MNKRHVALVGCLIIVFGLTGCWDDISIEDRGFIVGFAVDVAGESENGQTELTLTNQFIIPAGIGSPSDSGGGSEGAYMNVSGTGDSMYAIDRQMRRSISKMPYFEHAKIIVVAKDALEIPNLFPNMMDLFFRSNSIRRSTKIVIADGTAKDMLEIMPKNEKVPSIYLDQLLDINTNNTGGFGLIRLGDIHEFFLGTDSFTIPEGVLREERIDFDTEVVFNGLEGKVVGSLTGDEIHGANLLKGAFTSGPIEFTYQGSLVTVQIDRATSKIRIDAADPDNLSISVDINAKGEIVEVFGMDTIKDPTSLRENETEAAKKIEEMVTETIKKAQEELQTDVFGLKKKLRQRHYDTWEIVKDDWDAGENYFKDSTFNLDVTVNIRDIGDSKKSENHEE